jgi:hypothetical protein
VLLLLQCEIGCTRFGAGDTLASRRKFELDRLI